MSYNETPWSHTFIPERHIVTSENTVTTTTKKAATTVASALPAVVETAELAVEVPSKVVVNNKLLIAVGVAVGTSLGVAGVIGWQKFQAKRAEKKANEVPDDASSLVNDSK